MKTEVTMCSLCNNGVDLLDLHQQSPTLPAGDFVVYHAGCYKKDTLPETEYEAWTAQNHSNESSQAWIVEVT